MDGPSGFGVRIWHTEVDFPCCYGDAAHPDYLLGKFDGDALIGPFVRFIPDGTRIEMQFTTKTSGAGVIHFADGTRFVGEITDWRAQGLGVLYAKDGAIVSAGTWKKGKFVK